MVKKNLKRVSKRNMLKVKAAKICKAFEEEAEEILEDAEEAVKENFPARNVKAVLNRVSEKLAKEGISAKFDYKVTRGQLRATAAIEATDEEITEAEDAIVSATVAEFEDLLADTEEVANEEVEACGDMAEDVEDALKCDIESRLAAMGVNCKLARKAKKTVKKASRRPVRKANRKVTKRQNPILSRMK
jgi:plasmid stability protein